MAHSTCQCWRLGTTKNFKLYCSWCEYIVYICLVLSYIKIVNRNQILCSIWLNSYDGCRDMMLIVTLYWPEESHSDSIDRWELLYHILEIYFNIHPLVRLLFFFKLEPLTIRMLYINIIKFDPVVLENICQNYQK